MNSNEHYDDFFTVFYKPSKFFSNPSKSWQIDVDTLPFSTLPNIFPLISDHLESVFIFFLLSYWLNVLLFLFSSGGRRSPRCTLIERQLPHSGGNRRNPQALLWWISATSRLPRTLRIAPSTMHWRPESGNDKMAGVNTGCLAKIGGMGSVQCGLLNNFKGP